jgi:hypothetical protein
LVPSEVNYCKWVLRQLNHPLKVPAWKRITHFD